MWSTYTPKSRKPRKTFWGTSISQNIVTKTGWPRLGSVYGLGVERFERFRIFGSGGFSRRGGFLRFSTVQQRGTVLVPVYEKRFQRFQFRVRFLGKRFRRHRFAVPVRFLDATLQKAAETGSLCDFSCDHVCGRQDQVCMHLDPGIVFWVGRFGGLFSSQDREDDRKQPINQRLGALTRCCEMPSFEVMFRR